MGLVISMVVLCCIFAAIMAYTLVKGHQQIKAELALKVRLFSLFVNDENSHNESFGKAHCIVMDLADAIEGDINQQYEKTQMVFVEARKYKAASSLSPITLPKREERPILKAVK